MCSGRSTFVSWGFLTGSLLPVGLLRTGFLGFATFGFAVCLPYKSSISLLCFEVSMPTLLSNSSKMASYNALCAVLFLSGYLISSIFTIPSITLSNNSRERSSSGTQEGKVDFIPITPRSIVSGCSKVILCPASATSSSAQISPIALSTASLF